MIEQKYYISIGTIIFEDHALNMTDSKIIYKTLTKYLLIPICIFVLFQKAIYAFLSIYLVSPLLSRCYPGQLAYDFIIIILVFAIVAPLCFKIFKNKSIIPLKWQLICLVYICCYVIARFATLGLFNFTPFSLYSKVKLLDIVSAIPAIILLSNIFILVNNRLHRSNVEPVIGLNGFIIDEAVTIHSNNDILKRGKFIEEIVHQIDLTESPNGSFPIGIVGTWGIGKSTVIKSLITGLKNKGEIIELNVWKCSNPAQIIETLFKSLKSTLTPYSFSIDNKLQEYTSALLKGTQDERLNAVKNFSELFFSTPSIDEQYDRINAEIKRIGKKIFVVIDDLDRLDKKEIYEVIRLVRNTASFSNTFFIVAYDRNYILNAIEEINPYQSHYFLEKIFQLEFTLPPIAHEILQDEVSKRLESILTEADMKDYKFMLKESYSMPDYGDSDLSHTFIHNIRDVIRFINSFKLSYRFVKDEVFFNDFYNLELIRFKHPELFVDIFRNYLKLLTPEEEKPNSPYLYSLSSFGKEGRLGLRTHLETHSDTFKIKGHDIDILCSAYSSIFPPSKYRLSSRTKGRNGHLTVLKPSMFDRYFLRGIEGQLSEIEFSNLRQLPLVDYLKGLTTLSENEDLIFDISDRLRQIKNFDDRSDFEKTITAIFHYANLPHPNPQSGTHYKQIQYDGDSLAKLIGTKDNLRFYSGDMLAYKTFLATFLNTEKHTYSYTSDFTSSLLHKSSYYVNEVYPHGEISEILLSNFSNAIEDSTKITRSLWWHFVRCEKKEERELAPGTKGISYLIDESAISEMKKFVFEQDLDGFLKLSIVKTHYNPNRFCFGEPPAIVFGSIEEFIAQLQMFEGHSVYKEEYLALYNILITNEDYRSNGAPLDFFSAIPVQSEIEFD